VSLAFLADLGPEAVLVLGAAAALAVSRRRGDRIAWEVTAVGIAACCLTFADSLLFWHASLGPAVPDIEHGSLLVDRYALFVEAVILAAAVAVLLLSGDSTEQLRPLQGEFTALVLLLALGGLVAAASQDLVTIGVGLTLAATASALLLGLRKREGAAAQAAVQSFCLLAGAVALFLAGVVVLYGLTGTTQLTGIAARLTRPDTAAVLAAALLILGAGGLLGLGPFLGWRRRSADPAPLAAVLAVTTLGGLAGLGALVRVLDTGFARVPLAWTVLVAALGAATALGAALLALRASRLRQLVLLLVAGDAGLALTALPALHHHGAAATLLATLVFAPLAAGGLGMVGWVGAVGDRREDLRGLWGRAPGPCVALVVVLAALAGLPPLAGFISWFQLLGAAMAAGFGWVTWVAVLAATVAAVAVLRWVAVLLDPDVEGPTVAWPGPLVVAGLGLTGLALLLGGPVAGPLVGLAARAARPIFLGF